MKAPTLLPRVKPILPPVQHKAITLPLTLRLMSTRQTTDTIKYPGIGLPQDLSVNVYSTTLRWRTIPTTATTKTTTTDHKQLILTNYIQIN